MGLKTPTVEVVLLKDGNIKTFFQNSSFSKTIDEYCNLSL
jgi:hypothetical protein